MQGPLTRPLLVGSLLAVMVLATFGGVLELGWLAIDQRLKEPGPRGGTLNPFHHQIPWSAALDGMPWLGSIRNLDSKLFGTDASGQHASSLAWHLVNTLLAFAFLWRSTGKLWATAIATALWAVHPLRTESVACLASRSDLVSGLLFFSLLLAWQAYLSRRTTPRLALALGLFAVGLAASPLIAATPLVLLMLAKWPLANTVHGQEPKSCPSFRFVMIPFAALALGALWLAASSGQWQTGSNYIAYLWQSLVPQNLSVHYPAPKPALALISGPILALVSLATLALRKHHPALALGWFWFLAMPLPSNGWVDLGYGVTRADRFTYLSHFGLILALVFGVGKLLSPAALRFGQAFAVTSLFLCCLLSARQTETWKSDRSLWLQALGAQSSSPMVQVQLAETSQRDGDTQQALEHWQQAHLAGPEDPFVMQGLGDLLMRVQRTREAAPLLRRASELQPDYAEALISQGELLVMLGEPGAALIRWEHALKLQPMRPILRERVVGLLKTKAREAAQEERWTTAVRILEQCDSLLPDRIHTLRLLEQMQLRAGQSAAAEQTAVRIRRLPE